jgi:hypothetical protein
LVVHLFSDDNGKKKKKKKKKKEKKGSIHQTGFELATPEVKGSGPRTRLGSVAL